MGLESGTYIDSLNSSNPVAGDPVNEGDDHIRLLKSTIAATFPNVSGAVTATGSYHRIDTEGDAGTDSLITINGGVDGQLLVLQSAGSARDTTLEDTGDAGGNLFLNGDFTLSHAQDSITLLYSSADSGWIEVSRSDNG